MKLKNPFPYRKIRKGTRFYIAVSRFHPCCFTASCCQKRGSTMRESHFIHDGNGVGRAGLGPLRGSLRPVPHKALPALCASLCKASRLTRLICVFALYLPLLYHVRCRGHSASGGCVLSRSGRLALLAARKTRNNVHSVDIIPCPLPRP